MDIRRLSDETNAEIDEDSITHKFKGRGQLESTLITYTGLIKLAMALPGKHAKLIRAEFASKLMRYYAGDALLVAEIERNKESTNFVNVAAREEMAATGADLANRQDTLLARYTELESKMVEMENRLIKRFVKNNQSERRKQISDEKRKNKHEIEVIRESGETECKKQRFSEELKLEIKQKEINMELKKQEEETRILEKRIPILKQHDEIEKAKFDREMLRLDKEIQLKATVPASAPEKLPSGYLTTRNVGTFYGIFKDVATKFVIRISNSAMKAVQTHPHNIQPVGYVEDTLIGKKHPYFHTEDIPTLKRVLEYCKMEEERYENIKATLQDIQTAVVVQT